jgi:hypothetical protein
MKGGRELVLFACLGVFLGAPYIPNGLLKATVDSYVGVAVLLLLVLYTVRQDMVAALAVFLAAGALFLENRKRLVAGSAGPQKEGIPKSEPAPVAALSVPAPPIHEDETHPDFEIPERESHGFEPQEDTGSQDFRAVGPSINQKEPLETMPANSSEAVAEFMEKHGFAP